MGVGGGQRWKKIRENEVFLAASAFFASFPALTPFFYLGRDSGSDTDCVSSSRHLKRLPLLRRQKAGENRVTLIVRRPATLSAARDHPLRATRFPFSPRARSSCARCACCFGAAGSLIRGRVRAKRRGCLLVGVGIVRANAPLNYRARRTANDEQSFFVALWRRPAPPEASSTL